MDNKKRRLRTVHKKSRHGCVQCKRRHVKCDEQRPCGHCERRRMECSLTLSQGGPLTLRPAPRSTPSQDVPTSIPTPDSLPLGPSDSMSNTSSVDSERIAKLEELVLTLQAEIATISKHAANASFSVNTSHSATPVPPTPPPPTTSPPESIEDIRLFHHFCVSTSKTLATEPSRHKLWSEFVPQLACTHPFLMRGLLAVSALHLAHLHPHQHAHYTHLSTHHQTLALALFTAALPPTTALSPTTSPAFLLLSSLVFLLNTYPLAHPHNTPITLPSITQSLSLLRGTISLLLLSPDVWQHARSGPLRDLFAHVAPAPRPRGPLVDKLDGLVDALRRELVGTPAKAKMRVALLAAVEALRHTYALLVAASAGDRRDRLWTWAVVVPEEVLGLVEGGCAVALVVLAYFCVLVGSVECGGGGGRGEEEEQWFMKGWSGGVVECVVGVLERKEEEEEGVWREWVEWPVSCVRKGLNVLETAGDDT